MVLCSGSIPEAAIHNKSKPRARFGLIKGFVCDLWFIGAVALKICFMRLLCVDIGNCYEVKFSRLYRLKSGDAVIIAPPLGACASPYKNRLHTASNAPEVLQELGH